MSNKCCGSRSESTPPQASYAVALDALPEEDGAPGALDLEGCFEGVFHEISISTVKILCFSSIIML